MDLDIINFFMMTGNDSGLYYSVQQFHASNGSANKCKQYSAEVSNCIEQIEDGDPAPFITISANEVDCAKGYKIVVADEEGVFEIWGHPEDEDDDEGGGPPKSEYIFTHPGDCKPGETDAPLKVVTKAAMGLYALAFHSKASTEHTVIRAAYPCQFLLRVDSSHQRLYLDCQSPRPELHALQAPLMKDFSVGKRLLTSNTRARPLASDSSRIDLNQCQGDATFVADVGRFAAGTLYRLSLPLADITGIRLLETSDYDNERSACIILQLGSYPSAQKKSFATRKIYTRIDSLEAFQATEDWTPGQVASTSHQICIYGTQREMHEVCAYLALESPRIAQLFVPMTRVSNCLATKDPMTLQGLIERGASLAAPIQRVIPAATCRLRSLDISMDIMLHIRAFLDVPSALHLAQAATPFKTLGVFTKLEIGIAREEALENKLNWELCKLPVPLTTYEVTPCLRAAISRGHIQIDRALGEQAIIYEGPCYHCGVEILQCTFQAANKQRFSYDWNDPDKCAVQCGNCEGANHVTRLCEGKPSFTSGKFHNHCESCPDFGVCIGDYRNAHCHRCESHYFAGNSGFPCSSCGGAEEDDDDEGGEDLSRFALLSRAPVFPSAEHWSGDIAGLEDALQSEMSDMGSILQGFMTNMNDEQRVNMERIMAMMFGQTGALEEEDDDDDWEDADDEDE